MSSHHSVTADSPRRLEAQSTPRSQPSREITGTGTATPTYPPLQSLTAPQATSSPRQYLSHPQPPAMPVEVLPRPALPHSMSGMPWQSSSGRSDERLPSVRSLIHLPPLEPPLSIPHPPLATPLHHPSQSQPPPARHSWPLPGLAGPLPPPPSSQLEPPRILTASSPRIHHQTSIIDYARHPSSSSSRPIPPRPHSLTTISPTGYVTSPGGFSAHADSAIKLSPQGMGMRPEMGMGVGMAMEMRTPRRGSPIEVSLHNYTAPSSRVEAGSRGRGGLGDACAIAGGSVVGGAGFQGI